MKDVLMPYLLLLLMVVNLLTVGVVLPWMVSYADTFLVIAAPFVAMTLFIIDFYVLKYVLKHVAKKGEVK